MKEVRLATPDAVIKALNTFPNPYIFRGQASADWKLASSLERILGNTWSTDSVRRFEDYALDVFRSKFHLYAGENHEPKTRLGWLSLLQHHGAPTRLLDFSESPYVALYFALESLNPALLQMDGDAAMAIYALNYTKMMEASIQHIRSNDSAFNETRLTVHAKQDEVFENIVDRFSYPIAWVTEPKQISKRVDLQSGCFLVSGDKASKIEIVLSNHLYNDIDLTKFTIPVSLYGNLFALLRKMNITSKSIYGDMHGLCQAIRMEIQIYAS